MNNIINMNHIVTIFGAASLLFAASTASAGTIAPTTGDGIIQLSELDGFSNITSGWSTPKANKSVNGNPITIMGEVYESGIGTHATSVAIIELNGATSFYSILGVDDEADQKANHGAVDYVITLYGSSIDDATVVASGHLDRQTADYRDTISIPDLTGKTYLKLEFNTGANDYADHADWADARFTYEGTAPRFTTASRMFSSGVVSLPAAGPDGEEVIPLSSLDITLTTSGWGTPKANKSIDGNDLTIGGVIYESGIGTHASGKIAVKLNGACTEFHAVIGIDDEAGASGNVVATVSLIGNDGKETIVDSQNIKRNENQSFRVDIPSLGAARYLIIDLDENGGNGADHVDIANAYFLYQEQNSSRPEMISANSFAVGLFGATRVFSQPGVRFMQKLRSHAESAVITVENLPAGLAFDADRCLVVGTIAEEGEYTYTAVITTDEQVVRTPITLTVSSSLLMPTPLLGWLSWNSIEGNISEDVVKTVADRMVDLGLAKAGYNYLIIDDLWHASARNSDGSPRAKDAFTDNTLAAAADYVHSKGLKFGNYSDAAANTCAGAYGSHNYYEIDAKTYSEWGIDIVKVDYCGAPADVATARNRYGTFGRHLTDNGVALYMCEWGVREPWKWAAETGSSMWRCTYDTRDCWTGKGGGIGVTQSIAGMKDLWPYNGVNHWNDADMVMIGLNGTGKSSNDLCATGPGMTKTEYRTQMALWCMWSSPITLSCDLRKDISSVDLAIMTNPELLAINQDRMGQAGENLRCDDTFYVMSKDLENGDIAISVTNLSASRQNYTFNLAEIPGLDGNTTYTVRDLMKCEACPDVTGTLEVTNLAKHATAVYRLSTRPQSGINAAAVAEALGGMTASSRGNKVRVCLPGTDGASKRILISDVEGRVIASATTSDECADLNVPAAHGIVVINATTAARSHSLKLSL